jgi:hypothetical protein
MQQARNQVHPDQAGSGAAEEASDGQVHEEGRRRPHRQSPWIARLWTDGGTDCWDEPSILLWYDRAVLRVHSEAAQQPAETEVCLMFIVIYQDNWNNTESWDMAFQVYVNFSSQCMMSYILVDHCHTHIIIFSCSDISMSCWSLNPSMIAYRFSI